jgi:predicted transcriptional regulator
MFQGYMDALRFTISGSGDVIEHALQLDLGSGVSMRQMAAILHSNEDQSLRHPGDTAGRHLINIEARVGTLRWPAS